VSCHLRIMEYFQKMAMEKVMGSFMGGGFGDSSSLQEKTKGMDGDQLRGYLHTAAGLMEKAASNSMISQSAYSSWVREANTMLQSLDERMGGGGPTDIESLKQHAANTDNPEFHQGAALASEHGAALEQGAAGGGYGQQEGGRSEGYGQQEGGMSGGYGQQQGGMSGGYGQQEGGMAGGYGQQTSAEGESRSHGWFGNSDSSEPQSGGYGNQAENRIQGGGYGNQGEGYGNQGGGYGNQGGGYGNEEPASGGYGGGYN